MLIIHNIVLEMRKPLWEETQKGIAKDIANLLPLLLALILLNFLICIYTIFMPVMGNALTTSAWDHLFNILLLILSIMRAHTVSKPGMEHHPMTDSPSAIVAYTSIHIPFKVLQLIWRYKGQLWRSNYRIIIRVPCKTWTHYGTNQMSVEQEHNFKQLAWIQMSQFYANDLLDAINQITPYEDLPRTKQELQSYVESNLHKKHFIKLFYKTNMYVTLENWVLEEAKKATFKDHFHEVPLDYVAAKSLNQSHHPTSSPNHHKYNFNEEWENAGISSSSDAE